MVNAAAGGGPSHRLFHAGPLLQAHKRSFTRRHALHARRPGERDGAPGWRGARPRTGTESTYRPHLWMWSATVR